VLTVVGFSDARVRAARLGAGHLLRVNINGSQTAKDNNGFISRVRPDGAVENLKFIEVAAPA